MVRAPADRPPLHAAEHELIARCRRGERAALEQVFRTHAAGLERLIARLVRPSDDVEDVLQSTFEAAIGAFPRFRGEAAVSTWLASIAVRIVQHELRRPERRRRVQLSVVGTAAEPASEDRPQDLATDDRRAARRLEEHLAVIAPKKRVAFVLQVLDGRPVSEVAALVGASETTTRSRVFWARRELLGRVQSDPELSAWLGLAPSDWRKR